MNNLQNGLIKSVDKPIDTLTMEQKAKLNRRGNELFNKGDITSAERIFITTGYLDGLTRVGDYYFLHNDKLSALKFYSLARNSKKESRVLDELAQIVKLFL